jgi:hypothetical protein
MTDFLFRPFANLLTFDFFNRMAAVAIFTESVSSQPMLSFSQVG